MDSRSIKSTERGNVLWFILLAVGLLGLLTYTLSRNSSSVSQTGDVEQQRIKISQILRYTKGIEASMQRLMMNGCGENEINFDNDTVADYDNPKAPGDGSCDMFSASGAGQEWRDMREDTKPGTDAAFITGVTEVAGIEDSGRAELLIMVPVTKTLCTAVNKSLDISTTDADVTNDSAILGHAKFQGVYTPLASDAIDSTGLTGHPTSCTLFNGAEDFGMVYKVLLGR